MSNSVKLVLFAVLLLQACGTEPDITAGDAPAPRIDLGAHHDPAGFTIAYPTEWERLDTGEYPMVWSLQVGPGTNLLEKRMEIDVRDADGQCRQSTYSAQLPGESRVTIGETEFLKQAGSGVAAGNLYEWTSYSRTIDSNCITITFVLHSSSSGGYATEPQPFDHAAEGAVFGEIIDTFRLRP